MYRRPLLVAAVLLLPLVGILQGCAPPGSNTDGTFSVKLPKGKYGIQIVHMGAGGDQLQGKFNNQNDRKGGKAKIEKEVSGDVADMVIELDDYK